MKLEKETASKEIRQIIENRVKAIASKDVDLLLANQADDVSEFDVLPPLQFSGRDKVRERVEKWFSSYQGPVGYEIGGLEIEAGNDLAFCHYLYRITGTLNDGNKIDMKVRATLCFRKEGNNWLIVHEHNSVPLELG